jgi:exodeoxyribonuclease-5
MVMLDKFIAFMNDPDAWELYITGGPGTGKTTGLGELTNYCMQNDIEAITCAYTHKACGILASKLPAGTNIATLHSVLRKRPMINDQALKAQHIEVSRQHGKPNSYQIMFVDEYSMVGEQDLMDITAMQDPEYEADVAMKVVYIGDPNQLPPVGDIQAITPSGPWWIKLTQVYRQAEDNELLDTIYAIKDMIEGGPVQSLPENKNFIRGMDIVNRYKDDRQTDKVILAYTNQRVESLNAEIQGYMVPLHGDDVFSPTTRELYLVEDFIESYQVVSIIKAFGDEELGFNSKYKTLEHLITMDGIQFIQLHNQDEESVTHACIFGHYQYKIKLEALKCEAANTNRNIESTHKVSAKVWASLNSHTKLARARAKAWRDYLTFKECVICLDFPHAMTVHKSQGSTYNTVYLDSDDLYLCATRNFNLYLKLMYVAISRASNKVYTN